MSRLTIILFAIAARGAAAVLHNNSIPMLDTTGKTIQCADSTFTLTQGRWFAHCVSYGLCVAPLPQGCTQMPDLCGFQRDHNVSIFSSPDLSTGSWTFEGLAFTVAERPPGILYRPHLVFNPNTELYVLWANILDRPRFQGYFAATSKNITGPFTVTVPEVPLARANCGDFDLHVDVDGTGYVIYTCGHVMSIEPLRPDFLAGTGAVTMFDTYFVEAPVLFRRGIIYYALFGWCCCYCKQGSGVMVHTAPHPMGPWTLVTTPSRPDGDVACVRPALSAGLVSLALPAPVDTPNQGCLYQNGTMRNDTVSVTRSQQNSLIRLPSGDIIWTGNRWGQAPDGIKGHEPLAWLPLSFDADGAVLEMEWVDAFDF